MFFQTHETWERKFEVFDAIFGDKGLRRYPLVQLTINCNLFHIDALTRPKTEDDVQMLVRFIATDLSEVLQFMSSCNDAYEEIHISLQSTRHDNDDDEYGISIITEIIEALDSADQIAHIFCCKNGKRYVDCSLAETENVLRHKKTIYLDG